MSRSPRSWPNSQAFKACMPRKSGTSMSSECPGCERTRQHLKIKIRLSWQGRRRSLSCIVQAADARGKAGRRPSAVGVSQRVTYRTPLTCGFSAVSRRWRPSPVSAPWHFLTRPPHPRRVVRLRAVRPGAAPTQPPGARHHSWRRARPRGGGTTAPANALRTAGSGAAGRDRRRLRARDSAACLEEQDDIERACRYLISGTERFVLL